MEYIVLILNFHPKDFMDNKISIPFRANIMTPVEIPVSQYIIVAIPLTPPPHM